MDLTWTDIVKPSDERPARMDGTCFYCSRPMGEKHNPDCVIVGKTVTVRLTLDLVIEVPRAWQKDTIEFARNESSWCKDNLLEEIGKWAAAEDQNCGCSCAAAQIEYLRDATEDDHARLPLIVDAADGQSKQEKS